MHSLKSNISVWKDQTSITRLHTTSTYIIPMDPRLYIIVTGSTPIVLPLYANITQRLTDKQKTDTVDNIAIDQKKRPYARCRKMEFAQLFVAG